MDKCKNDVVFDQLADYKIIRVGLSGYLGAIKKLWRARSIFKEDNFDEVILMGHHLESIYAVLKKFMPFTPVILAAGTRLHYPNSIVRTIIRNYLLRRSYCSVKKIIVISGMTRKILFKYCQPQAMIRKIHRPVDEKLWCVPKQTTNIFTMATVARLTDSKNITEILWVLKSFRDQGEINWRFLIFGEGEQKTELEKLTEQLDIAQQVEFRGAIPPTQLPREMAGVDLFILLSKSESFGRVYVEAAALGIPSIAYKTYGTYESIKNNYSGFVFSQGDRDSVLATIKKLYHNPELRLKFSQQAKDFFDNNFSKKIVADKIIEFLAKDKV